MTHWEHLRYKNLSLLAVAIVIAFWLSRDVTFTAFLLSLGSLGYFGAFVGGMLFVISFTLPIGAIVLAMLSQYLSPIEIGIIAGAGAVVGDLTIFRIVRDDLSGELKTLINPLYNHFGGNHLAHLLHTKYFSWTLPVLGAIIIASPIPDEIGVSLIGISKLKTYQFVLISYLLNSIGIFLIISASILINR